MTAKLDDYQKKTIAIEARDNGFVAEIVEDGVLISLSTRRVYIIEAEAAFEQLSDTLDWDLRYGQRGNKVLIS